MVIRNRTDDDVPACVDILRTVHELDGYPVHLPENPESFLVVPDTLGAWVAEDPGDGIVGHVLLRPSAWSAAIMEKASAASGLDVEHLAVVARLLVAPWARRRGVGRALLDAAASGALELGRQPVLDVVQGPGRGHAAAIELYERAGWRRAGTVTGTFSNGATVDEAVYIGPTSPSRSSRPSL